MLVYIYAADIYCQQCGEAIRERILQGFAPDDPDRSYDFPRGPYPDGGGEADCPLHCGAGSDCHNAIELLDGSKVGAWLENELTTDGIEYVSEAILGDGDMAEIWAGFYRGSMNSHIGPRKCE